MNVDVYKRQEKKRYIFDVSPFTYKFFVTSFKYSANSAFKSSLESAKSTVACKNPCLLPISYLLPSKSVSYTHLDVYKRQRNIRIHNRYGYV